MLGSQFSGTYSHKQIAKIQRSNPATNNWLIHAISPCSHAFTTGSFYYSLVHPLNFTAPAPPTPLIKTRAARCFNFASSNHRPGLAPYPTRRSGSWTVKTPVLYGYLKYSHLLVTPHCAPAPASLKRVASPLTPKQTLHPPTPPPPSYPTPLLPAFLTRPVKRKENGQSGVVRGMEEGAGWRWGKGVGW